MSLESVPMSPEVRAQLKRDGELYYGTRLMSARKRLELARTIYEQLIGEDSEFGAMGVSARAERVQKSRPGMDWETALLAVLMCDKEGAE